MKPENPSEAEVGQGERAPQDPPSKQDRPGTRSPNTLVRLLGAVLGIPAKPETGIATGMEAEPEPLVEQEMEPSMPEINALAPEGPDESPREENIAGSWEKREMPAGTGEEETDDSRRATDILARALSQAKGNAGDVPPEPPPEDLPPEEMYPSEPWEPMETTEPPEPPEPPQPPPPPAPDPFQQMQELIRSLTEHFDAAVEHMAEERRALTAETQSTTRSALEQLQEVPRVLSEHLDSALERLAEDHRAFVAEVQSAAPERQQDQELPRLLAEHFNNALDRVAEERHAFIEEALSAARSAREQSDGALQQTQELIRALTEHFDRALDRMAEERCALIDEVQSASLSAREQTERALDRMEQDRRSLTDQITSLGRTLERLESRFDDLSRAVSESRRLPITAAIEEQPQPEETEPAFRPSEEGLTLVISAVPGFQGLMEVQRALARIPAIEGASVERYFDGEARIVLTLREPITAPRLLEALNEATGQELQLEESRPDAMRMRVRFQASEEQSGKTVDSS